MTTEAMQARGETEVVLLLHNSRKPSTERAITGIHAVRPNASTHKVQMYEVRY